MAEMLMAGDDRRMQVRAYKFWSSLLHGQNFPRVADLPLDALPDFGPSSILIDLRGPQPLIRFLGEELRIEAGLAEHVLRGLQLLNFAGQAGLGAGALFVAAHGV